MVTGRTDGKKTAASGFSLAGGGSGGGVVSSLVLVSLKLGFAPPTSKVPPNGHRPLVWVGHSLY